LLQVADQYSQSLAVGLLFSLMLSKILNKKFWEELIVCSPLIRHGPNNDVSNNSSIVACVFVAAVTFLPSRYLATMGDTHADTLRDL
jgi:hypothetical protein